MEYNRAVRSCRSRLTPTGKRIPMPARLSSLPPNLCVCLDPNCSIVLGCCHCGCGEKTSLYTGTNHKKGWRKGYPTLWINGHRHMVPRRKDKAAPFKIDGVYCRIIHLTQDQFAIVNDSDYEWLSQWNWNALWSKDTKSYYARRAAHKTKGESTYSQMSRAIMGLTSLDEELVDHKNGVTLDNRRNNLRLADYTKNMQNRKTNRTSKSQLKGVSWNEKKGLYVSSIMVNGKSRQLGKGSDPYQLHLLYRAAARKAWGEFARFE